MTTWTVPPDGDRPEVTFHERPSGTVTTELDGFTYTVSYLDGGWWPRFPMAPPWVITLWMENNP